jgi:hypothetical protein
MHTPTATASSPTRQLAGGDQLRQLVLEGPDPAHPPVDAEQVLAR